MCGRCARTWETTRRDPNVFCPECERETAEQPLFALVFVDGSGILALHESAEHAHAVLREDVMTCGMARARFVRVVGQSGARAELSDRRLADVNAGIFDRAEAVSNRADYERDTSAYR